MAKVVPPKIKLVRPVKKVKVKYVAPVIKQEILVPKAPTVETKEEVKEELKEELVTFDSICSRKEKSEYEWFTDNEAIKILGEDFVSSEELGDLMCRIRGLEELKKLYSHEPSVDKIKKISARLEEEYQRKEK